MNLIRQELRGSLAWELLLMLARRERDRRRDARRIRRWRPGSTNAAEAWAAENEAHNAFEIAKRMWNEYHAGSAG